MSIVSKLFSRKSKTLIGPLVGATNNNQVTIEFDRAFRSLDFNPLYADRIGSYLVSKNPSIDGTIYDETPNRKTRTELTARATSFSTNQRFYGGNTSTGKTALSVFAWVRPTSLSGTKTIFGEYDSAGADRGWVLFFSGSSLTCIVSADGANTNAKNYVATATFSTNEWVQIGFVFSGGVLTLYINGKEAAVTKSTDRTVTTIHDSSETIEIGSRNGGGNYFDGQIQTPLIWESALTAAEVRDLYLGKYDQVTTPDLGWLLDGTDAHKLTSGSPILTAANTPTRYEDELAPDYLNKFGYNESGGNIYPKRINSNVDSNGNPPDNAHSFGECKRNWQLLDGPCLSFGGTEYATNGNLVGTETVVSSEGTSTPTISAGRIDFTAGTCWNLLLSNGSHYAGSEEAGIIWYDDVNDEHLTFVNTPSWSTQDTYFWSEANGFSLYEHASSADILVPLKSDGTAITITPPTGYTKTADYIAGSYHNNSQALLEEFPVTDSGSQRAVGYGASFDNTTNANINADTAITGYPFSIECDVNINSLSGNNFLTFLSPDNAQYFGLYVASSGNVRVFRKSGGVTSEVVTSSTAVVGQWHKTKIVFESETEFTLTFDSVPELFASQTSVTYTLTAVANDLWIGQYRPAIGESPDFKIKNVVVKQGDTIVNNLPLYIDPLDRSSNCYHGTLSATGVSFATEARATNLNPTIAETNTRAVTTGDRKIIRIGQQ